jgi:hypothetical protein
MYMKGFIYITTNNITGKKYIGKKYYYYRNGKKSNWESYLGSSKLLLLDISKYGSNNFSRVILEEAETEDKLAELEKKYIDSHGAVESDHFYNLSNSVDKFFTTSESTERGISTRKKWSNEKKQLVSTKLKQRWENMSDEVKSQRSKKISEAHKNNSSFKKMRSEIQKNVWLNYTPDQKNAILEKRSNQLKQRWSALSDVEKQEHIKKRQNALIKMNTIIKNKGEKEREKWNNMNVILWNIKSNIVYERLVKEIVEEFNIPYHTIIVMLKTEMKITNKGYGKYNTYKRTWKIKVK